jgi:hypothetical protein
MMHHMGRIGNEVIKGYVEAMVARDHTSHPVEKEKELEIIMRMLPKVQDQAACVEVFAETRQQRTHLR